MGSRRAPLDPLDIEILGDHVGYSIRQKWRREHMKVPIITDPNISADSVITSNDLFQTQFLQQYATKCLICDKGKASIRIG